MKIAWFTPFSQKSAIGLYSKYACEALNTLHEVQIYTSDTDVLHKTNIPVKIFDSVDEIRWSEFDICFYNIGDNADFHSKILDCAFHYPGVLVLHDKSILNLWTGYYILHKKNQQQLKEQIEKYYGTDECNEIFSAMSDVKKWAQLDPEQYSGLELIAPCAKAILVHSEYHASFVRKICNCPIQVAYFPFHWEKSCAEKKMRPQSVELLTVGNVNYNKRIAQVITAIGTNDTLKKHIHYTVAGGLGNKQYSQILIDLIAKYELNDTVLLKGYTPDDELEVLYQRADILMNLRNPALEGASWSLVEQMYTGKPIIVSDTGFYAEMPKDCVYHITTDEKYEVSEIQKALLWLLDNWEQSQKIGHNAYCYAKEHFAPEQYLNNVNYLINTLEFQKPIEQLVELICYEFQSIGVDTQMEICREYADEIENLFFKSIGNE